MNMFAGSYCPSVGMTTSLLAPGGYYAPQSGMTTYYSCKFPICQLPNTMLSCRPDGILLCRRLHCANYLRCRHVLSASSAGRGVSVLRRILLP